MERGDYRIVYRNGWYYVVTHDELGEEYNVDYWESLDQAEECMSMMVADDAKLMASIVNVVEE